MGHFCAKARPRHRRRLTPTSPRPVQRGCVWGRLLSSFVLPVLVNAASHGVSDLQRISERVADILPEALPETPEIIASPGAPRDMPSSASGSGPGRSAGISREPIQHIVARCQAEATLEAYGELLEAPVVRVKVFVPGRLDLNLRLPTAAGGMGASLEATLQLVVSQLGERWSFRLTSHQPTPGLLTAVAVPSWMATSLCCTVAVDLTAIGGPIFAVVMRGPVYRSEIEDLAAPYGVTPLKIFTQDSSTPWAAGVPHRLSVGQVVRVQWSDVPPVWQDPPSDPCALWKRAEPLTFSVEPWQGWVVVQEDRAWLLPHAGREVGAIYQAISEKLSCPLEQLCFQVDPRDFTQLDFTFKGRPF